MDTRKLKVGDHVKVNTGIDQRSRSLRILDDSKPVLTGSVVGIGPRLRGDLDTQVRIRLDSNGAHISAPAPQVSLLK